jgi:hypothetical protein
MTLWQHVRWLSARRARRRGSNAEVMEQARNFAFRRKRRIGPAEIASALHEGRAEREARMDEWTRHGLSGRNLGS